MTESKPEVSNSKIFDVDTLTKQFAFLAILLYIIGFLILFIYEAALNKASRIKS
jgi:hypothetical protein